VALGFAMILFLYRWFFKKERGFGVGDGMLAAGIDCLVLMPIVIYFLKHYCH